MNIFSWNVNGIRAILKKGELQSFIKDFRPDILCLQETKAQQGQAEIDLPAYEEIWNSATRPGYSGTAIFTKAKPLSIMRGFSDDINTGSMWHADTYGNTTSEGRVLTAEFSDFFLVTVYVPNSKRELTRLSLREKLWDPALLKFIKDLEKQKPVVICGDFNVAHAPIDLARPNDNTQNAGFTEEERKGFDNLMNAGFIDTFRQLHPDEQKYSWWTFHANARIRNIGWRIDYFLISPTLLPKLKSADIHDEVIGSDHAPISIKLDIKP
ncbi:MAG: exodeoxyribonuclease III [Candidatus Nomurabacteria bacterium]|jgi:exodeoxyribonuclease-3|nr:exodeoxyribonuclease III [Candidatus Nomurabacteria bacterium]